MLEEEGRCGGSRQDASCCSMDTTSNGIPQNIFQMRHIGPPDLDLKILGGFENWSRCSCSRLFRFSWISMPKRLTISSRWIMWIMWWNDFVRYPFLEAEHAAEEMVNGKEVGNLPNYTFSCFRIPFVPQTLVAWDCLAFVCICDLWCIYLSLYIYTHLYQQITWYCM